MAQVADKTRVADPVYPHIVYYIDQGRLTSENLHTSIKSTSRPIHINTRVKLEQVLTDMHQHALKFVQNKNENVEVTPCGLILLSRSDKITQVNLNKSFTTGVHCWEFYCPLSCYGITIGLRQVCGRRQETFDFSSSTPRTITLKLDMNRKELMCWINLTVPVRKPIRQLCEGGWSPFIRIKEKGNIVVLNPFASDPERQVSQFNMLKETQNRKDLQPFSEMRIQKDPIGQSSAKQYYLRLINNDTLAVIAEGRMIKLLYRNQQTQRFDQDSQAAVLGNESDGLTFELNFTQSEIDLLTEFSKLHNVKWLTSATYNMSTYTIRNTEQQWTLIIGHMLQLCDKILKDITDVKLGTFNKDNLPANIPSEQWLYEVYRILSEKIEQLKPYLKTTDQTPISEFDRLSRWSNSHIFFKDTHPEKLINVPKSLYQNSLPPIVTNSLRNLTSTNHYLLIESAPKEKGNALLELYNYQLVPFKIMNIELWKGFIKATELNKYKDIIENMRRNNELQPSIYKILSNCLTEAKKAKLIPPKPIQSRPQKEASKEGPKEVSKYIEVSAQTQKKNNTIKTEQPYVDPKLLETFKQMGFPIEKCKKAIIQTKNVSFEVALEHFFTMPDEPQQIKPLPAGDWSCPICTLINTKVNECQACGAPMPTETTTKQQSPEVIHNKKEQQSQQAAEIKEQRVSKNIEQPLLCYAFAETNFGTAPIILVGCFETTLRIRLVGQNPMYYSKFYLKNQKGFVDYSDLSFHDSVEAINQRPIRFLENIFVGGQEHNNSAFGWIVLEDQDVKIDLRASEVKISHSLEKKLVIEMTGQGKKKTFSVEIKKQSVYNEMARAIICKQFADPSQFNIVSAIQSDVTDRNISTVQKDVSLNSNSNVVIECVFSQCSEKGSLTCTNILEQKTLTEEPNIMESSNGYIPLIIEEAPPGCNMHYPVCSILYPSNNTFLANYPYRIVMKHLHGKLLQIDSVMIEKIGSNKNAKLIKSGNVYLLNDLNKQPAVKHYFEVTSDIKKVQVFINDPRIYQYLVIEPIYQNDCDVESVPFEIGLVGALGRGVQSLSKAQSQNTVQAQSNLLRNNTQIELYGYRGTDRHPIVQYDIDELVLNDRTETQRLTQQELQARLQQYLRFNIPLDICLQIRPRNSQSYDRIQIEKIEPPTSWQLVSSCIKITQKPQSRSASPIIIHKSQSEMKLLIAEIMKGTPGSLEVLVAASRTSPSVWKLLIDTGDVGKFIEQRLLKCSKEDYQLLSTLVGGLVQQPELLQKIDIGRYLDVGRLSEFTQSAEGIQLLLRLVQHSTVEPSQLNTFIDQLLDRITLHRNVDYRSLRKSNNCSLGLETSLFSDYYFKLVQSQQPEATSLFESNHFISKFVVTKSRFYRKYIIDLTNRVHVRNLLLSFDKSNQRIKMIIRAYRIDQTHSSPQKVLVFEHYYQEAVWIQLTRNAYSNEMTKLFKNPIHSGLNCLGVSGLDFHTRYLIVEIAFTLVPNIGDQRELENLPSNEVIPEVFGEYSGELEPLYQQYFDVKPGELSFFNTLKFHEISRIAKYSFVKENVEYLYYDNEDNMVQKDDNAKHRGNNEMSQVVVRDILQKGSSRECLDYDYTAMSILLLTLSNKHLSPDSLGEETCLRLFELLVKNEKGPIADRSINLLRKLVKLNDRLYIKLLKQSHTLQSFGIFRDIPVKQSLIKSELLAGPSKDFVKNSIGLIRVNQIQDIELVQLLISQAIKNSNEEITVQLLKAYRVKTSLVNQILKGLCQKQPQEASQLIKNMKQNSQLLTLANECMEDDYKTFELIVDELVTSLLSSDLAKSEEFMRSYKTLTDRMMDLFSRRDSERDLKVLIKLARAFGLNSVSSQRLIELFVKSRYRGKLQSQFLSLKILKTPDNSAVLMKYILTTVNQIINEPDKLAKSETFLCNLLVFLTSDSTQDFELNNCLYKLSSSQLTSLLMDTLSRLLNQMLMVVGIDNVKLSPSSRHRLILIANYLTCIACLSVEEPSYDIKEEHVGGLINWFLVNNVEGKVAVNFKSYLLNRFGRLTLNVRHLINAATKPNISNHLAKFVLVKCLEKVKQIDRLLPSLKQSHTAKAIEKIVSRGFKTLTSKIFRNPQLLSYYCCDLDGFSYMLDNICGYQSGTNDKKPITLSQEQQVNQLAIVGEAVTPKDWLVNKVGNKSASIYNITYSNDMSKDSELLLQCQKGILVNKLAIGLVVTENAQRNNVLPREIELYGGNNKEDLQYLGTLESIPDDHYLNYSTKVYGINLNLLKGDLSGYDELFQQLNRNTAVKYLRLVFKRPDVASLCEIMDIPQKSNKNLWSSVSFLSVVGYLNVSNEIYTKEISNSLKLLRLLSDKDNNEVIANILSRKQLVDKLQKSLNRVCEVITELSEERLFHNFISVISGHSAELGDCIIDRYLTNKNTVAYSHIVSQIVLSNYSLIEQRVKKLHRFVIDSLNDVNPQRSIIPFVRKEIEILHIVSLDCSNKHAGRHINKIVLEVKPEEITNMVRMGTDNWSEFEQDLIKLAVSLTLVNEPFALSNESILQQLLQYLWKPENRLKCIHILAAVLIGNKDAVRWFVNKRGLQTVFQLVEKIMCNQGGHLQLTKYLLFLSDLCNCNQLKNLISTSSFNVKVFQKLIVSQEKIGGATHKDLRKALVEFLVNSTINTEGEKTLANLLKQSLDTLGSQTNNQYLMEMQVFLPILNSYGSIPVCLQSYNEANKQFISNPNEVLLRQGDTTITHEQVKQPMINPAIGALTKPQILKPASQLLTKDMQVILSNLCPKNVQMQLAYSQAQDGLVPAFQTIKNRLLGNSFLIIIQARRQKGPDVLVGVYYQSEQGHPKSGGNEVISLRWNPSCFLFYFEQNGKMVHYKDTKSTNQPIVEFDMKPFETLEMGWTEEGGQLNILLGDNDKIKLNFRSGGITEFDFSNLPPSQQKITIESDTQMQFARAEYWLIRPMDPALNKKAPKAASKTAPTNNLTKQLIGSMTNIHLFNNRYVRETSAATLLRSYPVYVLPSELKISEIKKMLTIMNISLSEELAGKLEFFTNAMAHRCNNDTTLEEIAARNNNSPNLIVDLQFKAEELFNEVTVKELTAKQAKKQSSTPIEFLSKKGIFKAFESAKGVTKLIDIVNSRIQGWKHEDRAKKWLQYIQELKSFSSFPYFFSMYMKEKETVDLLLNLLVGLPDREEPKKWQQMQTKAIRQLYKIVAEVLLLDRSLEFRQYSIKNKFITTVLDRLQLLSKQEKRKFVKDYEQVQETTTATAAKPDEQDVGGKKVKKKKGVGYGTESSGNTKWTTGETSESKKQTSQQIQNILTMVSNFLNTKDWKVPPSLIDEIMCSCLLPLVESMLRAGTLLEISKDPQNFKCVLRVTEMLSRHRALIPCLMDLPKNYQPSQSESIFSLLKALENTSRIFIACLGQNSSTAPEANKVSEDIAREVMKTFKVIEEAVEDYKDIGDDTAFKNVLELPLDKKYKELLKDLRFDYISMRDANNRMKHHYNSYGSTTHVGNVNKTIRLAQQLADLSTSLPIEHTNSIFVRCDKDRVDFMQALIMGANGTPYGHGAYLFDIYFDDSYPNGPPKVNLMTTGAGKVRFNPNLYSCGKVCLSLLGTWRGNATENWDPKVSTLLQVLVSIQAIIMSDDVYFNEPGFQNEQGSDEGEKKNEAYSNIVRYSNIKFAMIDNMKHPPAGFQTVIRRHFYLKKDEIIQQAEKWLKYAQKRDANYVGLVSDHNNSWSTEFKKSKGRYLEMLTLAVTQLKEQLNKLPAPSIADIVSKKASPKKKKEVSKQTGANQQQGAADLNDIDVSYDSTLVQKELTIDDEKVRDRWSRYIGAMGIDAVSKQAKASVLVVGLGPFSLEVTKNIVLSGCRRITIYDNKNVSLTDLSGGFFYSEADIGKKRLQSILHKIQQLNQYVKVDTLPELQLSKLKDYDVVFLTETPIEQQIQINQYCRQHKIKFISADCMGPYSRLFNDFGEKFEVLDKNGEEAVEVMIKNITTADKAVVTLLDGVKHPYEDGEVIIIKGLDGMQLVDKDKPFQQGEEQLKSINGTLHKIETINSNSFRIGSTLAFKPYIRNGTAKNLKLPVQMKFPSLAEVLKLPVDKLPYDDNLLTYDFIKMQSTKIVAACFNTLNQFITKQSRQPKAWSLEDSDIFLKYFKQFWTEELTDKIERFIRVFCMVSQGNLPPLCAFWGGFVSQQIIKAITQKFKPTNSMFFCEFSELVQQLPSDLTQWSTFIKQIQSKLTNKHSRAYGFELIVGQEVQSKIESCKLFMIGAGAIGCQLLKNFAMINLSVAEKGSIVLTDPDHIETSNLNRQFLFREKHIRKPKSSTAAASVIQMNPLLKGHIIARLDKIHDGTKDIFSNKFFRSLTIVANALDNVQARRYVDQRCVQNKIPLLESGTLGPKGHVQVIVPDLTESYGSKNDPAEEGEIPHCTLKMFPEDILHCIEWARDKFGHKFSLKPKALIKVTEDKYKPDQSEIKTLNECYKFLKKRPGNFDDCIAIGVNKFYKYFRNDVMQLMYTYPIEAKTKNGEPFWKLPKRPPTPIAEFNPQDLLHCTFVASYAVMLAKIFNIPFPKNFRVDKERFEIGKIASKIKIEPFIPSDKKAKNIISESEKKKEDEQEKEEQIKATQNEIDLYNKIKSIHTKDIQISPEQFEKDEDGNGHIDFIYSMANLRASNYKLEPMDWVSTKIKAGRIVPALSTTTTAIAGLQTMELCKYLKKVKLDKLRNAFLNLAVPVVQLSEPGQVEKVKLTPDLSVTIWDRWEVKCSETTTLRDLFTNLESKYKLRPRDVFQESTPIYLSANMEIAGKQKQKEQLLGSKLLDLLDKQQDYIDLIVTFSLMEDNKILNSVPSIRLLF